MKLGWTLAGLDCFAEFVIGPAILHENDNLARVQARLPSLFASERKSPPWYSDWLPYENDNLVQVRTARTADMNGDCLRHVPPLYCFRSQPLVSASQTQSVNNRFRSGRSASPLR